MRTFLDFIASLGFAILAVWWASVAGLPEQKSILIGIGAFGIIGVIEKKKVGAPVTGYDRVGFFVSFLSLCGGMLWAYNNNLLIFEGSPQGGESLIVVAVIFGATISVYGIFAWLSILLPAPSGERRPRPGRSRRPYVNDDGPAYGGNVDPGQFGRGPGPGGVDPDILQEVYRRGMAAGAQRAAPVSALRITYREAHAYSTDYAEQVFQDANVQGSPSDTRAAQALAEHVAALFGPAGGTAFLNHAARDRRLPKKTRQFYTHALQKLTQ
ncbi:MAG: hypothetical protein SV201_09680 [Pseudomonadota bacterium]|nr:hypothetical protein [Pseudomonadota bacterium]